MDRREFTASLVAPLLVGALPPFMQRQRTTAHVAAPFAINPPSSAFMAGMPTLMELSGVPGVSISVIQGRDVVAQHTIGLADTGTGQAVSATTVWPAASLSKPPFAWAALRLVDQGKLDLDRPLKSYVPDHAPSDARGDKITARHVLSHSSGLKNWRNRPDQPLVPDFEPGARFQYSGEGFYYLQRAVEHIA